MLFFDGEQVKTGMFPNKETYVDIDFITELQTKHADKNEHVIEMRFEGNDDIANLIFLKGALNDAGVTDVSLIAPYFPYSTMDRTEDIRALSCKYVSQLINDMGFSKVSIKEAHSSVVLATLDRVENDNRSSFKLARQAILGLMNDGCAQDNILVAFPDKGASGRYQKMFQPNNIGNYSAITTTLEKTRDFVTGYITGMKFVDGEENVKPGMTAVIIDDLCRGGRTFVEAGKALKAKGIEKVILCVTHLENTVFGGPILAGDEVDEILSYRFNSLEKKHEKIRLVNTLMF